LGLFRLFVGGRADGDAAAGIKAVDDIEIAAVDRCAVCLGARIPDDGADDRTVDSRAKAEVVPASEAMTAVAAMRFFMGIILSE